MTIPKNLLAEAKAALPDCHEYFEGIEWLWSRLCELSEGEFNEQAIAECAGYNMVDIKEFHKVEAYAVLQFAKRIARRQHSLDMAALLRQREEIARLVNELVDVDRDGEFLDLQAKCERLEKALREIAENVDDISSYEIARLALEGK